MADATTKRKRGRPSASHASKPSKAARTEAAPEQDANDETETRPKKRRRSIKDNAQPETEEPGPTRRRTRRSLENTAVEEEAPKQKRGQGQGTTIEGQGRAGTKQTKPKARPSNATMEEQQDKGKRQRRVSGRQALKEKPAAEAQNKAPAASRQEKPRRGRPSTSAAETTTAPSPPKRKRGRPSRGGDEEPERQEAEQEEEEGESTQPSRARQRGEKREAPLPPKRYLHVAPHVRGVKQSTIDAKWTPLGAPSIAAASEILELAHRPIIQRMSSTARRRQHTSGVLSVAYRRITRKLQRGLPFPPAGMPSSTSAARGGDGGRETELDFESVLDGRRALERQLDPALHAVELLKKEKARVERELERDYMTLRNLEAGARTQAREQREKLKRAHVLAPEASGQPHLEDVEMIFDDDGPVSQGNTFKDLESGELKDLALQLSGHMDSIKTNLQQTDGLLPQMNDTKSALRLVLLQHLDQKISEKAVLGA